MGGIVDLGAAKRKYAEEVQRGMHDHQCEFGPRVFIRHGEPRDGFSTYCYCSRRRRMVEPIPDMSVWPTHACPLCWKQPDEDECGYTCFHCEIVWDSEGKRGRMIDPVLHLGHPVTDVIIRSTVL